MNELIDEKDRVKGQAYVTMTMSIGTVIGVFCFTEPVKKKLVIGK